MHSISPRRLRQIIAEEVAAVTDTLEVLPVISKKATTLLNAVRSFKDECPESCMHSVGDVLSNLEKTLEDMAHFPGNYASLRSKQSIRDDVDNLVSKEG